MALAAQAERLNKKIGKFRKGAVKRKKRVAPWRSLPLLIF
jgi:hypothetical protein